MGAMLSVPVWLASNLYPMWLTYRVLEGVRALVPRNAPGARYEGDNDNADGEECRRAKDAILKFWVMHAALQLLGSVISRGTFTALSVSLISYDTGGAAKLYDYFVRPLLANREPQIEAAAANVYTNAVELWYRPAMALLVKAQTMYNNLLD